MLQEIQKREHALVEANDRRWSCAWRRAQENSNRRYEKRKAEQSLAV